MSSGVRDRTRPETVEERLARADATGAPIETLIEVADRYIEKWARLAAAVEAGADLDGRASIYTGETYAEARDTWMAYRDALHARLMPGAPS